MANEYKTLSEADLDKLTNAVFGLFPRGALFNVNERSNLFRFVKYIADNSRGDLTYISDKLMDELNPDRTDILLDFWIESAFSFDAGDECITREELRAETKEERRRILIARLLENGRVDRDYIEQILNLWVARTDIRVYEFFPSRLDIMRTNNTINESTWIFIDSGNLLIGERFTSEVRALPSWADDYYIYAIGTQSGRQFGVWTNVDEWRDIDPTLTGDVEWNSSEGYFRLGVDGKIRIPAPIGRQIGDTIIGENGQGTILASSFYSTVLGFERYLDVSSSANGVDGFESYIYNQNGNYNYVYANRIDGSLTLPKINLEEWEAGMIYAKSTDTNGNAGADGNNAPYTASTAFYFDGKVIDEKTLSGTNLYFTDDAGVGNDSVGVAHLARGGPLYIREFYLLVEKDNKNLSYEQWLERRKQVAIEVSTPLQKYDTFLDAPFYNSTFNFVDGDLDADDVKTFDLVKCILKRILPLSLDYNTGKTT